MRRVFSFILVLTLCVAGSGCWWHDREGHERDRQGSYGERDHEGHGEHDGQGYGDRDRQGYGDRERR